MLQGKLLVVVAAAIVLARTGPVLDLARPGEASTARSHYVVEIRGLRFRPAELTVQPGDTVTWVNRDIVAHTASATEAAWSSGELGPGESWQWIARRDVDQKYYCEYHPSMRGEVIISPRAPTDNGSE